MAEFTLTVYEEDDATVYFEVGTAAGHANPYLQTPEIFAEAEIDLLEGSARIGRLNVRIIDPQTGPTQVDRFLTSLLGNADGYSEINGRRVRVEHSDGPLVLDGVCAGPRLLQSYAGFELAIEDIRARGIKVPVFSKSGTSTVFPRGVLDGYGTLPNGSLLVPATIPARGTFHKDVGATDGWLGLEGTPEIHARKGWFLTDAMLEATVPEWSDEAEANVLRNVEVWWRAYPGGNAWTKLVDMPVRRFSWEGGWRGGQLISAYHEPYVEIEEETGNEIRTPIVSSLNLSDTATASTPGVEQEVEVLIVYTGPPSEQYPFHFEGTAGELLRNVMRGDYSFSRDEAGSWTAVDPKLRYDETALIGLSAPQALSTPVRVRIFEPAADLRDWMSEACKQLGVAPALDDGLISPVGQQLPDESVPLPEINNTVAQAHPSWEHPVSSAVTQLDGTYPRDFLLPASEDPDGSRSAGDGIATVDQVVTVRPKDPTIQQVMGIHRFELDGWLFRALGGAEGQPLSGDVQDEAPARFMKQRGHELIDRFCYGGQGSLRKIALSDAGMASLKVGDWALDAVSWEPNYQTGQRGRNHLVQVVSVRKLNAAWGEIRIVDAAPYANPVGQPTLGAITVDGSGVVSVPVTALAAGAEARVDFAVSETEPTPGSPLWTFLGRTASVGTLTSPALPAASTVWIRARGEKEGRRPSAWTNASSVSVTSTPRVLSADVQLSAGTATVTWEVNGATEAVRVYYAAHGPSATPSLLFSLDADADDGSLELPIAVSPGQKITVDVEPWTGWDGSSATGTAGARVRRSRIRPSESSNPALAVSYEVVEKTDESVTLQVFGGADVEDIFVWSQLIELPQIGSRLPTSLADRDTVLQPGDTYVIPVPPQGHLQLTHFAGYSATGENGEMLEFELGPGLVSDPLFEYVNCLPGGTAVTADVELRVRDPQGLGGTLKIWSNKSGFLDPNPAAVPDSTLAVASTPATVGPGTWSALDEINIHPGRGKTIFLEFVNSNGDSSGVRSEYLHSWTTIVDVSDALRAFSVGTTQLIDAEVTQAKVALRAIGQYQLALAGVARENAQAKFVNAALLDDNILDLTNFSRVVLPDAIAPSRLAVNELSEIAAGAGIILTGELRNAAGTRYIKINASGGEPFIAHDKFVIRADGYAEFSGTLAAATIIAGRIVTSSAIANGAINDPIMIVDGTLRANHILAGEIQAVHLTATLAITVGKQIRSASYSPGSAGWAIHGDGTAELNNVVVRGTVYASAGEFSGSLNSATGTFSGSLNAASGTFAGTVSGSSFTAPTATFSGTVKAGSGTQSGQLTSDVLNFKDSGGTDRAQYGRLTNDAVIQASADIRLNAGGVVNFGYAWDTTARLDAGSYLPIKVNGTTRYVLLYS